MVFVVFGFDQTITKSVSTSAHNKKQPRPQSAWFDDTSAKLLLLANVMILMRAISLTNFMVASSALGFQVFVLYPWDKELDVKFEKLKTEHFKGFSKSWETDSASNSERNPQTRLMNSGAKVREGGGGPKYL